MDAVHNDLCSGLFVLDDALLVDVSGPWLGWFELVVVWVGRHLNLKPARDFYHL